MQNDSRTLSSASKDGAVDSEMDDLFFNLFSVLIEKVPYVGESFSRRVENKVSRWVATKAGGQRATPLPADVFIEFLNVARSLFVPNR